MSLRLASLRSCQLKTAAVLLVTVALCSGCALSPNGMLGAMPMFSESNAQHVGCATACEPCDTAGCGENVSGCCDVCGSENCAGHRGVAQYAWTPVLSIGEGAAQVFGNIANFCVPAAAMGPAEIPPPGRFHPVPTQPVFAPIP